MPKPGRLLDCYRRSITGSDSGRVAAFFDALNWWDEAMTYYLSIKPLDVNQVKKYDTANKVRTLAVDPGAAEGERVNALERCIKLYEKIWDDRKPPAVQSFLDKYNTEKADLAAKEQALTAKYNVVLEALNHSFSPIGIEFAVQVSDVARQFDGNNKVLLSRTLAKVLSEKARKEGLLPVVFSEAYTVLKAASVERDASGTHALNFQKFYTLFPKMMESILQFCGTVDRHKVFKAVPVLLEATVSSQVNGAAATPKMPRVPGAHRPRMQSSGPLVGGKYRPGCSFAVLYQVLEDQQPKPLADVLASITTLATNPMDRLKWLKKRGIEWNLWTVTITKHDVQMEIH